MNEKSSLEAPSWSPLEEPRDKIVIKNGRVREYEHWVRWIDEAIVRIVRIVRQDNGEFFAIGDNPAKGRREFRGTLEDALCARHSTDRAHLRELFELENPTEERIKEIGFSGFRLITS